VKRLPSIRNKVYISFALMIGFNLCLGLLSVWSYQSSLKLWQDLSTYRVQTAFAALSLRDAVRTSQVALQNWVVLADDDFLWDRAEAVTALSANVDQLRNIAGISTGLLRKQDVFDLEEELANFVALQDKIEEQAHATDNQPASLMLTTDLEPLAQKISEAMSRVIQIENDRAKLAQEGLAERQVVLNVTNDFMTSFNSIVAAIKTYILTKDLKTRNELRRYWAVNTSALERLWQQHSADLNALQKASVENVRGGMKQFAAVSDKLLAVRESDGWNKANYLMENDLIPARQRLIESLDLLINTQKQSVQSGMFSLEEKAKQGELLAWIVMLVVFMVGLIVAIMIQRVTNKPLKTVMAVSDRISSGALTKRVDVTADYQETRQILISLRIMQEILLDQFSELKTANKQVMDSIGYAQKIQQALLPQAGESMDEAHFVLWEPRDLVGGDMFLQKRFDDGVFVAVVDCTGHGVPGAFMSMLAVSALNHLIYVHDRRDPAVILRELNIEIKQSLNQQCESEGDDIDDGMDVGLCFIDKINQQVIFAGAKSSLMVVQSGELRVIKGDKSSVGYRACAPDYSYSNHCISTQPGDAFYLVSDGFPDQIGVCNGKKLPFGNKRLRKLMQTIHDQPFDAQMTVLKETLNTHQGSESRRDDITVLGFGIGA